MRKLFSAAIVALFSFLALPLPGLASEIPKALQGVMNLRHPSSTLYVSGQPKPEAFAEFARAGVKNVISLRPPQETPGFDEAEIVAKAGMAYYNIPIRGAVDLTRDNMQKLDALLGKIGKEPVLIHCSSSNRVGALMALRAAWVQKASVEDALKTGERYGIGQLLPDVKRLLAQEPR